MSNFFQSPFVAGLVGKAGKAISTVGTALHAPQLAPGGFGAQLQAYGGYFNPVKQSYADTTSTPYSGASQSVQPSSDPNNPNILNYNNSLSSTGGAAPSTGGQSVGGGGSYSSGGSSLSLTPPSSIDPGPSSQQATDQLNAQYAQAANDIKSQEAPLDQSYNQATTDINNALNDTVNQANVQKQNINNQFGDILKNTVNTYRTLNQQRNGTFSALGSLDSSAYADQQQKADQDLSDQEALNNRTQQQTLAQVDSQLNTYKNNAMSQLGQLASQYQQGKTAIANALAQNNIQGANAISQALQQIRANAQAIQNNMINFANQAALLKSQGYNVGLNIAGINGNQFGQTQNAFLNGIAQNGAQTYQLPTTNGIQGQGYIMNAQGQRINPLTGLPA